MNNHGSNRNKLKPYIYCRVCNRQISRNQRNKCNRCHNKVIGQQSIGLNFNDGEDELHNLRQQIGTIENLWQEGINRRNQSINNQGYIDSKKHQDCIRLLSLNLRGFGPDNKEKMERMIFVAQQYEIDGIILSSPDHR